MNWLEERQNVPAGTVIDLDSGPKTVLRDWDTLVIPGMRLDAEGCKLLRQIINDEMPNLSAVHEEIAEDEAERAARAAGTEE